MHATAPKSKVSPPPLPGRSGAERRTSPRVAMEVTVGFMSDTNFFTGFTEDVSEGGLFVATVMLKPVGTELELRLGLPDDFEFQVRAIVRWLRDPHVDHADCPRGMGLQFIGLSEQARAVIHEFIALRQPIFYDP